jgi:hypothetical protein
MGVVTKLAHIVMDEYVFGENENDSSDNDQNVIDGDMNEVTKEDPSSQKAVLKGLAKGAICRSVAIVLSQPFYGEPPNSLHCISRYAFLNMNPGMLECIYCSKLALE